MPYFNFFQVGGRFNYGIIDMDTQPSNGLFYIIISDHYTTKMRVSPDCASQPTS